MKTKLAVAGTALLILLLAPGPALAQEPGGGGEEEYDVEAAIREVTRLLTEAEKLLVLAIRPGGESPAGEAAATGREAAEALDKLLGRGEETGRKAADLMKEILENAPRRQGQGQGQSQEQQEPGRQEDEQRKQDERRVDQRDPKNSEENGGKPEDSREKTGDPEDTNRDRPESEEDPPAEPDPDREWLANLPEKVRQAFLNGDWEILPEKWRDLIEAYRTRLAEEESDR